MAHNSCDGQLKRPLISADGSQDVMVVVQCAATPQLHTLPTTSPAAAESIKAFADSIAKGATGKLRNVLSYTRLSKGGEEAEPVASEQLVKQWHNQTALMWVWLLSSLVVVMFVPLFVAPGALLLCSMTASALGVIAVFMHSMAERLSETGTFSVNDQIDLAAACATAAACVDLLAMAMTVGWVWYGADSVAGLDIMPLLMFACNCWQHGVASVAVMQSVGSLE